MISQSTIIQVVDRSNLLDIVQETVSLKRVGKEYVGCCPFHNEKTGSFHVDAAKNMWYCHGACHDGGGVIDYVMRIMNCSFVDAVKELARRCGVAIEEENDKKSAEEIREMQHHESLLIVLSEVQTFYADSFCKSKTKEAEEARAYASRRWGEEFCYKYGIGYADESWDSLIKYADHIGIGITLLDELGLVSYSDKSKSHYDFFRGRIMIPIRDNMQRVIGFTARAYDPDGTNHITDDGLENNLVLWNIINDELSFVSLDPEYYLYSYKLMVSDNDEDHLYALGCLKDNKEILLLEIDIHSGKITSLGKYNDNQINEKPYSEQKVIGEQDGYVYYLGSAEKNGEGISQALYRYKGNEEEIVIEDLYHSNELSISIGTLFSIIDNKLYYTGFDRTAEETYSFEADLTTGEVSYKKGYIGKITGKYQDHLIIISNDAPMGIIGEYNMPFAINEEEYLEKNPEIIYFEPSGQNE